MFTRYKIIYSLLKYPIHDIKLLKLTPIRKQIINLGNHCSQSRNDKSTQRCRKHS